MTDAEVGGTPVQYQSKYSLAGVRSASTRPHEQLIDQARQVFADDERILAAYLVGGFAIGAADAFSDVDIQCVIRDDARDDLAESWTQLARRLSPVAHLHPFPFGIGGVCITPEWLHFDLLLNPQSVIDPKKIEGMLPLIDKTGILPADAVPRPDRRGDPFFPLPAVEHFLYMLGNMVSVIGRNEMIPASNGVILVRDIDLVGLLLAEQGWQTTREHNRGNPFPFTKRLRGYLTEDQNALLLSLPPMVATIDSVIDGYLALARAFLPRAKALADQTGATWPADYEKASISYFERSLGVTI